MIKKEEAFFTTHTRKRVVRYFSLEVVVLCYHRGCAYQKNANMF